MPTKETDRFECTDEDGNRYTVIEINRYKVTRFLNDPSKRGKGSLHYFLLDGGEVSPLSDDTFQIFDSEVIIKRIG